MVWSLGHYKNRSFANLRENERTWAFSLDEILHEVHCEFLGPCNRCHHPVLGVGRHEARTSKAPEGRSGGGQASFFGLLHSL
jgi:hypothetical protein